MRLADGELLDDAANFVNTASRDGRDSGCDVPVEHARVSSLHAVFTRGGGLLFLADAKSKNGTKLNWGLDDLVAAARPFFARL